ncbi:MAG: site-specific integrase, partial [Bifidobacterium sp.]|nr:site-specific integrase [Bifidobacterium sp.]
MAPKAEAACDDKAPKDVDARLFSAIERFIGSWRTERNPSENTVRAYRIDLLDYARWAKRTRVDGLHPAHRQLRRYLSQLEQAQYSRATVNRRLSAVRTFFQWLNVNGIVSEDPASALSGPKQPHRLPHHLRPQDVAALLGVYGKRLDSQGRDERTPSEMRNQALLEFLYACGARISEASGLLLSAVDFDQGQCRVLGKGAKERIVPLHDLALSSMHTYLLFARPLLVKDKECPYFFVSTRGNQMGTD